MDPKGRHDQQTQANKDEFHPRFPDDLIHAATDLEIANWVRAHGGQVHSNIHLVVCEKNGKRVVFEQSDEPYPISYRSSIIHALEAMGFLVMVVGGYLVLHFLFRLL